MIKGKIPSITGLATTAALKVIENKINNVSDLVKKTDYDAKISGLEVKYFTISDYKELTGEIHNAKTKDKGLVKQYVIFGFIDNSDPDSNTKAELKVEQDKIVKFQAFDSNYFRGKSCSEDDSTQNYLVFLPFYNYF